MTYPIDPATRRKPLTEKVLQGEVLPLGGRSPTPPTHGTLSLPGPVRSLSGVYLERLRSGAREVKYLCAAFNLGYARR